jgi:hypothetical protein
MLKKATKCCNHSNNLIGMFNLTKYYHSVVSFLFDPASPRLVPIVLLAIFPLQRSTKLRVHKFLPEL